MKSVKRLRQSIVMLIIFITSCMTADPTPVPVPTKGIQVSDSTAATATIILSPTIPPPISGDIQTRILDGMSIVYVPSGEFTMGSDEEEVDFALQQCQGYGTNCRRRYFSVEMPAHQVILDGFWLDQTEVTRDQYARCEAAGFCEAPQCQSPSGDHPVVCVTWEQALVYCQWAGGRLPTEAEWEYAARGLDGNRYPWGVEFDGTLLNYCDANCDLSKRDDAFDDGYAETAPVGSYPEGASWVGALDMAGNVWELVADWNGDYLPAGPINGSRKVARGGSWHASPDHLRSALRTHLGIDQQSNHAGFRCAQPLP
jgi:formylglycine-generating enzyme required for sulfatase activity